MTLDLGRLARRDPREAELERRIAELEERLRMVPSQFAESYATPARYYLECLDGNLLFTASSVNYYGLSRPSSPITQVPTLVPSSTPGALANGLSRGTLINNDGTTSTVWIGNNITPGVWSGGSIVAGSANYNDYTGYLSNGNTFVSRNRISVPVTGSPGVYATLYNPWRP